MAYINENQVLFSAQLNGLTDIDDTAVNNETVWHSKNIVDRLCSPISETGEAVICHPVEGYPLGVTATTEPVQAGNGDPSPENVRPITGRDSVTATRCGKNLIPYPYRSKTLKKNGVTFTANEDGSITANGTVTTGATATVEFLKPSWEEGRSRWPAGTYTISGAPATTNANVGENFRVNIALYNANGDIVGNCIAKDGGTKTMTITEEAVGMYLAVAVFAGVTADNVTFYPQMELGETATEFEPHQREIYTVPLGETVYGGSVDVTGGTLTKTHKMITLTGEESVLSRTDNPNVYEVEVLQESAKRSYEFVSSHFTMTTNVIVKMTEGQARFVTGNKRVFLYLPMATADEVKAWLKAQYDAGTPVQICYDDTNPETAAVEPVEILARGGDNTLYADSGAVTVTGREDPIYSRLRLEQRLAVLEAAMASDT